MSESSFPPMTTGAIEIRVQVFRRRGLVVIQAALLDCGALGTS
jgi:hypothetical protein